MVMVDSIYKYLKPYCDCYPIWKVHNQEFTIYPIDMNPHIFYGTTSIGFRVLSNTYEKKVKMNTWKIVSKKAKDFLFSQFKDLEEYQESIYNGDRVLEITIVIKNVI